MILIPFLARKSSMNHSSRGSEAGDMNDFAKSLCRWSWEENKLFELALAVVDEQHPERWEVVAAIVGGEKSAGDVQDHYVILLEDLHVIESGRLDHRLEEVKPGVLFEYEESICLCDNDTNMDPSHKEDSDPAVPGFGDVEDNVRASFGGHEVEVIRDEDQIDREDGYIVMLKEPKLSVARPVVWRRVVTSLPEGGKERRSDHERN
ncbi:hypothetical protein RJT34_19267 [Clitoria ternatea]|uniref:Myb-like domain-containing protein n=1 Tax=Clitoria ternatea TaxID=43366 RepID=A0AAN9IR09_CLITE